MFCSALQLDLDYGPEGWEVVARFGPDSLEASWSGVSDAALSGILGAHLAAIVLGERNRQEA